MTNEEFEARWMRIDTTAQRLLPHVGIDCWSYEDRADAAYRGAFALEDKRRYEYSAALEVHLRAQQIEAEANAALDATHPIRGTT